MSEIYEKFQDNNKFVSNLHMLYKELLISGIDKKMALDIINKVYLNNIDIKKETSEYYQSEVNIYKTIIENNDYQNYKKNEDNKSKQNQHKTNYDNYASNNYYYYFIEESLKNDDYLDILPKEYTKDSIKIFAKILNYFLVSLQFYRSLLTIETNDDDIKLITNKIIDIEKKFNEIIDYKELLKNNDKDTPINENKLIFFMNGDEPYIYYDIVETPTIYTSIKKLLDSIKYGTFKNLSKFVGYKNLLEVRDISSQTRILFERKNRAYVILGAITNKAETNKLYREKLNNRIKTYKNSTVTLEELKEKSLLKKILNGDNNE